MSPSKKKPPNLPSSRPAGRTGPAPQTATERRLAAQRVMAAATGARAARRKRMIYTIWAPILVVVVVAGIILGVKLNETAKANKVSAADAALVSYLDNVSSDVFNTVGAGSSSSPPTALTGAALTASNGLPRILYVGAEWCPICAAERWPLAVALWRFGSLSGIGETHSISDDVNPNTPTITLHDTTYTSSYIVFSGNEIENGAKQTLDKLDSSDNALWDSLGNQSFPFVDIGGKFSINTAQYDGAILAGKTQLQIGQALEDPTSTISKAIIGSANVITAAICETTKEQPLAVCGSSGVLAAAKKLPG